MSKRERERALTRVIDILRSRAHTFARKYGGLDYQQAYDEFFSQACLGFMQACEKWTGKHPSGGKFSSWCYLKVNNCLLHYIREKFKDRLTLVEEIKDEMLPPLQTADESSAAFRASLAEQCGDLSPEAKRMLDFIIDNPLPDGDAKPREVLQFACEEMAVQGYDHTHQQIMIHEIKTALYS
jgi:RNA polymerase sigma factor (sigma-70 family)